MKKIITFIVIAVVAFIIGFCIEIILLSPKQRRKNNDNSVTIDSAEISKTNRNSLNIKENVQTNSYKEKISVNTRIIQTIYYNHCNHQMENEISDINKYVNMTEERFQQEFPRLGHKRI